MLMQCGHYANATDSAGNKVCAICFGDPRADTPVETIPDLTGRQAHCSYCGKLKDSVLGLSGKLAFFQFCPNKEQDSFYCGCFGWD